MEIAELATALPCWSSCLLVHLYTMWGYLSTIDFRRPGDARKQHSESRYPFGEYEGDECATILEQHPVLCSTHRRFSRQRDREVGFIRLMLTFLV
jgi:hypothetical protein